MSSLCCALQAFSNLNDHTCLACGKSTFKTSQGVLKHLSQARGCQWYKKGKLKDLEMDIEVIEELPPNFLPYIPPMQRMKNILTMYLISWIMSFLTLSLPNPCLLGPLHYNMMRILLLGLPVPLREKIRPSRKFILGLAKFYVQVSHYTTSGEENLPQTWRMMWKWLGQIKPCFQTPSMRLLLLQLIGVLLAGLLRRE